MIKKSFIAAALLSSASAAFALELTAGKGNFDYSFTIKSFMGASVNLDVDLLSLKENHLSLPGGFYLFGSADLYRSATLDHYLSYLDTAASFNPFGFSAKDVASDAGVPVPVDFKMRGFDLLLGAGYDLLTAPDGSYIGLGAATGISMPFIETKQLQNDAQNTLKLLKETKTTIMSYKLMPTLQGTLRITPWLSAGAMAAYGVQYGTLENDYLKSSADFDGTVFQSDLYVQMTPLPQNHWYSNVSLTAGYRYNDWQVNTMNISIADGLATYDFAREMEMQFHSSYWYAGAGWRF
jgi:hypothetical protein